MKKIQFRPGAMSLRERLLFGLATSCMISANVAVYIGLCMPPQGEIHSSLLTFFGIVCAFVGGLFGLTANFRSSAVSFSASSGFTPPVENAGSDPPVDKGKPKTFAGKEVKK